MISPEDTRIAFFGGGASVPALEAIGRLANAGYDIICAEHSPAESVMLRTAGIACTTSRIEALEDSSVVITCKPSPAEVEDLYLGDNGILELMEPGSFAIDLSFSTPQLSREIQAMAAVSDLDTLDAPVLNVAEGEQSVAFIGGEPETIELLSPLFPFLGMHVFPQAGPGEGQFAALLSLFTVAGSLMGAVEAMSLARIAGFPEKAAIDAIASTNGGSRALVEYVPRLLQHDYSGRIKVKTMLDYLSVALSAAEDLDVTVPMTETAYQLFELLSVVGGEDLNVQALSLLYEDEATCSQYGLDWALADSLDDGRGGYYPQGGGLPFSDGPFGGNDFGGPQPRSFGPDDPDGPDDSDMPPIGGFFSKN